MQRSKLAEAAAVAVRQCLAVREGETVLVVCDEPCREIGQALWLESVAAGADAQIMQILPRTENGQEPPPAVAAAMLHSDVVFAPTSMSLSHTDARRAATDAGARIATLPGIMPETMERALLVDHDEIRALTARVADRIRGGSTARVTTPAGTDISFSIAGRAVDEDNGLVHEAGMTNLPAGEAYLAPVEGSGNGVIMVDGSMGDSGVIDGAIRITVEDGFATDISGHPYAPTLARAMDEAGPEARNLAELGIGTNPAATLCGNILEDEKILGTVHLAFGDNKSMGGNVSAPYHQDGILLRPSLWVDGEIVMKDGELLLG
jgi:leucyl aminopeptidase (aminopeptidase T)